MIDWSAIAVGVLVLASFVVGAFIGAILTFKGANRLDPSPLRIPKVSLRLFGRKRGAEPEKGEKDDGWAA